VLPWSAIGNIRVTNVPMKISTLGGLIEMELTGYHSKSLTGEFLGSQRALREALATLGRA